MCRCQANPRHKRRQGFSTFMGDRPCPHMCGHTNHFQESSMGDVPTYSEDIVNNQGVRPALSLGKSMVSINALAKLLPS